MSYKPLISVIIPTYNRANYLVKALDSVLKQTYVNWELIVIDDGSNDETFLKVKSYLKKPKVTYFYQKNRGVSSARNQGIKIANGDWVAFLDSDDEWLQNKLETQVSLILKTNIKWLHCDEIWMRNGKRINPSQKHRKPEGHIFTNCIPLCCVSPSAVMIKRCVFESVGLFDETLTVCEDYDLWLRISLKYKIGFIPDHLVIKNGGHDDQLSKKYFAMDYWRVKALTNILKDVISSEEKKAVISEITKKTSVLLAGYLKHNNRDNFNEVYKIWCQSLTVT